MQSSPEMGEQPGNPGKCKHTHTGGSWPNGWGTRHNSGWRSCFETLDLGRSSTLSNSLITGIYPAASARGHVLMFPPYKIFTKNVNM